MKSLVRTGSFLSVWLIEFARQPGLLIGLVLGPFIILLAFGQGVDVSAVKPKVIVVESVDRQQELQPLPEEIGEYVEVVDRISDLTGAIRRLQDGEVEGVLVMPEDPESIVLDGERIPIQIFTSDIDPLRIQFTEAYLADQVADLNREVITRAITEAQASLGDVNELLGTARDAVVLARGAGDDIETARASVADVRAVLNPLEVATRRLVSAASGISLFLPGISIPEEDLRGVQTRVEELNDAVARLERQLASASEGGSVPTEEDLVSIEETLDQVDIATASLLTVPPEVLSAPFDLQLDNLVPQRPTFQTYYSPAVLVLLVQHLGISLSALALARLRLLGVFSLLKVAPIRPFEITNGNFLAHAIITGAAAFIIGGVMYLFLGVPIYGSFVELAVVGVALVVLSVGVGLAIALITRTEQQAAQAAMLILLASVFFSGLVVSLDRIIWPMKVISYALPSTWALRSLHDIMLRGLLRNPIDLIVLCVAAVAVYLFTWMLLRRELRPE
jgi:ABC-2 type transport system permease protein